MKTLYKYVNFNEIFLFRDTEYTKANHNRGSIRMPDGRLSFRPFRKNDIVDTNEVPTILTQWMEIK